MSRLNRVHYNKCPECGEYLSQMGIQDAIGDWHGTGVWACTVNSHLKLEENQELYFAGRYVIQNGKFTRVPFDWRSDATGAY